jgi:membrane protein
MPPIFEALKSAWTQATRNNAGLLAAGIAYYAFLSFVPLIAAMVLSYGLFVDPQTIASHSAQLAATLPPSASQLVIDQIESVVETRAGTKGLGLIVATALSLFGARLAAGSVITALNVAFDAEESRGLLKANLLALAITLGAAIAGGLLGATTALAGPASLVVFALFAFAAAALAYHFVPNAPAPTWPATVRGAALIALAWTGSSAAFGIYAANFGNYNATYGSLSAVVVLLTWLFLSAYVLLLGGHLAAASDERS